VSVFGTPRHHVSTCGSTNDLARAWALDPDDPAPHGALVTADFQTQGRGRRGHRWDASAAESALMSFVLHPDLPLADAWHLGFITSLATADALRRLGPAARLKWPNDVLLDGAKVAGILVETILTQKEAHTRPGKPDHPLPNLGEGRRGTRRGEGLRVRASTWVAIAGIGINVNQSIFPPKDYAYLPTSLRLVTGRDWVRDDVIEAVSNSLEHWNWVYRQEGFASILTAWREILALGASLKRGSESGILEAITPEGHAHVRLADGTFAEWTTVE
jgi:biotin-(acetyl-CoA carboxylase) ligase